jgi:hypothetical protein
MRGVVFVPLSSDVIVLRDRAELPRAPKSAVASALRGYRMTKLLSSSLSAVCLLIAFAGSGAKADTYEYETPTPPGVAAPDTMETRFGTLNFFGGFPDAASVEKLYNNLDFQRAVQAYLLALPVVNQFGNRESTLSIGPANVTVPIWETMVDSRTVELTANDNTPCTWFWLDLHDGTNGSATSASPARITARAVPPVAAGL